MKKMLSIALVPVLNMFEQLCVSGRVLLYTFMSHSYSTVCIVQLLNNILMKIHLLSYIIKYQ